MLNFNFQKGFMLYMTVIMLAVFLAMGLSLNAMVMTQLKIKEGISNSLIAFFAADTGMEHSLFINSCEPPCEPPPPTSVSGIVGGSYNVEAMGESTTLCSEDNTIKCCDDEYSFTSQCLISTGSYREAQRRWFMRK